MKKLSAIVALAAATPFAAAQQGWVLEVDRTVLTPERPTAQATLSATHAPEDWAFVSGRLNVLAPRSQVSFWSVQVLSRGVICPRIDGCSVITEDGIQALLVEQMHNPPAAPARPDSPIALAIFNISRQGAEPQTVEITSETIFFRVAPFEMEPIIEDRVADAFSLPIRITDCEADCDADGELTFFDFLCFQTLFAAADGYADCDGSGEIDFFDFLCFQVDFAAGCP